MKTYKLNDLQPESFFAKIMGINGILGKGRKHKEVLIIFPTNRIGRFFFNKMKIRKSVLKKLKEEKEFRGIHFVLLKQIPKVKFDEKKNAVFLEI